MAHRIMDLKLKVLGSWGWTARPRQSPI